MINPLVSIITITLNKGNTLERTIKSVIEQDYPYVEYIIVDGCSTDNSIDVIKKYERNISKWISEPDKGPVDAMNKAFKMATGDIIALISSDDYYEPGVISTVVKTFQEHPEADVVHANFRYFNSETKEVLICKPFKKEQDDIYKTIYRWPAVYVNTFFVKKEIYTTPGILESSYDIACDFELCMKLFKNKVRFFYIDQIIVNHQSGGRSYRATKGYIEIKDISIVYGCSKIKAYYYLIFKLIERSAERLLVKCGFKGIRDIYAKLFYSNIITMGRR